MERQELLEELNVACQEASSRSVFMSHAIADEFKLNATDFECLDALRFYGREVTAGQLAQATGLTTGAITGIIDRLEKAGFVTREQDENDRRRVNIGVIEIATHKIFDVYGPLCEAFQELTKGYNEQELRLLIDFTKRSTDMLQTETKRIRDSK